ncbi:MAG: RNA methyltransferase [Lachnospiraceae bacterium]|nr:RNA methyltransferase [Lachnospiraceae bacterium]
MITSFSNQRIRAVRALLNRKAERDKQQAFVIEGLRILREAPAEDVMELYVTEAFLHGCTPEDRKMMTAFSCEAETVSEEIMQRLSDTVHPQGVLAVVKKHERTLNELFASPEGDASENAAPPLILVLENLQDPGNLGTILRSAEAAGVTGILLVGDCADIYSPKVSRSTMGAVFRMPAIHVADIEEALRRLKEHHIRCVAADVHTDLSYDTSDLTAAVALLIGNEGAGLSQTALAGADQRITIPMHGAVESLNAGVAASVLAFEAARQRRARSHKQNGK